MAGEEPNVDGYPLEVIPLHFNVPGHHLPLREFIETASNTQEIIEAFNETIFDGKLRYEILVIPPKPGTFTTFLGIVVSVGTGVWVISQTDVGKAFIKGLTGYEPAFWAEKAGLKLKEALSMDQADNSDIHPEAVDRQSAAMMVSEIAKGFLRKGYNELRNLGISKEKFRDAYKARNEFYQACYRNDSIRSIGFDETDDFPIERRDFPAFIIELPPQTEDEPEQDWVVEVTHIKVTSPNWDRRDESRQWKAKDGDGKPAFFTIEDKQFWHLAEVEELHTQVVDHLKVQWAFVDENGRRKNIHVLRVLEFNGDHISDPLGDEELKSTLGAYEQHNGSQGGLFDG